MPNNTSTKKTEDLEVTFLSKELKDYNHELLTCPVCGKDMIIPTTTPTGNLFYGKFNCLNCNCDFYMDCQIHK